MKGQLFECIKEFEISKYDCENDCFSDEVTTVEKGSVWECSGYGYICGGEIRLDNVEDALWLEISKETLSDCFKDITKDNNEMAENERLRSGY